MAKLSFFWMMSSVCAMCLSGFIATQNLAAQVHGMVGGWRESFWDLVWISPGIHLSFMFVAVFGAVFGAIAYMAVRHHVLTRNHIIIILAGIILFIFFSDYFETGDDAGWSG